MEVITPPWRNHIMHTLPIIIPTIESFLTKYTYPKSFIYGFFPTFFLSFLYITWVQIVFNYAGYWVYPFLGLLNPFTRGLFFIKTILISAFIYKIGEWLNEFLWSENKLIRISPNRPLDQAKSQKIL